MSGNTMQSNSARRHRVRAGVTAVALAAGMTAAGPGVAVAAERYRVVAGDTLGTIAEKFGYKDQDAWRRIYDANPKIKNPDLIVPGQRLTIPSKRDDVKPRRLPQVQAASRSSSSGTVAAATSASTPAAAPTGSVWTQLAACESGGNWAANTGNGYYGGLQFSLSSWQAVGGSGYPHQASPSTQIAMGHRLQANQGWGAWPGCAAKLGLY